MTGIYDWNPMPHRVAVSCPDCHNEAQFEFAEIVKIELKKDIPFFRKSTVFEYRRMDHGGAHFWHGAIYYHGLYGTSLEVIRDLPPGYSPADWSHSQYLYRDHGLDIGTIVCPVCALRRKHELQWPKEAHFQIEHRANLLWAFDRETTRALRDYIQSPDRSVRKAKWQAFLRHIPGEFLQAGAKAAITKKLDRLLSGEAP